MSASFVRDQICFVFIKFKSFASMKLVQIAQTGTTNRSIGVDGMLYANVNGNNDQKYKIMSERELGEEMRRSQEIRRAMIGSGKQSGSHRARPPSASITGNRVGSPLLRDTKSSYSRSPINNNLRNIDNEADDAGHHSSRLYGHSKASDYSGDFRNEGQVRRSGSFRSSADSEDCPRYSEYDRMTSSGAGIASYRNRDINSKTKMSTAGFDNGGEERPHATSIIDALKLKYEQNLDVIERLFDEKKSMETLVRSLDSQLSVAKRELASPKYSDRVVYGASSSGNFSDTGGEDIDILRRGNHLEEEDATTMRDYDLEFSRSSRPVPGQRSYNSLPQRDSSRSLSVARMSREYLEEESRISRNAYTDDVTYDPGASTASSMARSSSALSPRYSDSHQAWNSSCHISDRNPFYSLESREQSPSQTPRDRDREMERDRDRERERSRGEDGDRERGRERGRDRSSTPTSSSAYSAHRNDRRNFDGWDNENQGTRSRSRSFSANSDRFRGSRSRSHSRSFSTEPHLSSNLQADQDRYDLVLM